MRLIGVGSPSPEPLSYCQTPGTSVTLQEPLFSLSIVKRALAWQAIKSHTPVFRPTPTPSYLQDCWELALPLQDLVSSPTG